MNEYRIGVYKYIDSLSPEQLSRIPQSLQLTHASNETIMILLLLGLISIGSLNGKVYNPRRNYFSLPYKNSPRRSLKALRSSINTFFTAQGSSFCLDSDYPLLDKYFSVNRKNHEMYKNILSEITAYFTEENSSPISAFNHLYRCFEYMSYTFPLIYASRSRDYKGTFDELRKFLTGDVNNELKFFSTFFKTLFSDEPTIFDYVFEVPLPHDVFTESFVTDCSKIYAFEYELDDSCLKVRFKDIFNLFVSTRNGYFHMLSGHSKYNFFPLDYDMGMYLSSINPIILNWMAMIIQQITIWGFSSCSI